MAWGEPDFYDGARTQGHNLGITKREILDASALAEFIMTSTFPTGIDRKVVLKEFGFAWVAATPSPFYLGVIAQRPRRKVEAVGFFVVRSGPDEGVRFIGFSSFSDYKASETSLNDALGLLAFFAAQQS